MKTKAGICNIATSKTRNCNGPQGRPPTARRPDKRVSLDWSQAIDLQPNFYDELSAELAYRAPIATRFLRLFKKLNRSVCTNFAIQMSPHLSCYSLGIWMPELSTIMMALQLRARMVVTEGVPANPTVLLTKKNRGAAMTR